MVRVVLALLIVTGVARADDSEAHYDKGKQLYAAKDFVAAVAEFAAARAIDPQPRYVFNLAQAQRMAGQCAEAVTSYEAFLATAPVEAQASVARGGLEKCKAQLTQLSPPPPPAKPQPPVPSALTTASWTGRKCW